MGTTSNYSWPYPEATGLVKDGWEDIKDLATAIDTTAASTFTGGLVKINSTSFTSVASQSINDVFSTTYDFYRILFIITSSPSNGTMYFRLRASGSDDTTSNYHDVNLRVNGAAVSSQQGLAQTYNTIQVGHSTTISKNISMDIFNPFLSIPTTFNANGAIMDNTNNQIGFYGAGGGHNVSSSFTGFTFFPSAGNISGTIVTLGYKK